MDIICEQPLFVNGHVYRISQTTHQPWKGKNTKNKIDKYHSDHVGCDDKITVPEGGIYGKNTKKG